MTPTYSQARRVRYRVSFWDDPDVSYNCLLGDAEARHYALYCARGHGGRVTAEYSDGYVEEILPFGGGFGQPVLADGNLANPPSQAAKAA